MTSLPSLSAIEFPGLLRKPHDPRNAIAALGGEHQVRAALTIHTTASSLTLNLRPHPGASHSNITSEKPCSPTNLFLVRISASSTLDLSPKSALAPHPNRVRIVGHVTSLVRFRTLADFQYHVPRLVPAAASTTESQLAARSVFEALANYPHPSTAPNHSSMLDTLRPRRFARTQPEHGLTDYWFKQFAFTPLAHPDVRHALVPGRPLGDDRRSDANRLSLLHHWVRMDVDCVPNAPPDTDPRPVQRGREAYGELHQLLSKLFQIRPVWIRRALYEGLPEHLRRSFKRAISTIAYSFQGTGPFYQAWIRYGYDPRKDPSSRKYQVVEVRIANAFILAAAKEESVGKQFDIGQGEKQLPSSEASLYPKPFQMPGSFTLTKMPKKKNNFVQVCDIKLDKVVKVCEEEGATKEFHPKFGFFTEAGYQRLNLTIKETLQSICRKRLSGDRAERGGDGTSGAPKPVSKKRRRVYLKDVMRPQKGDARASAEGACEKEVGAAPVTGGVGNTVISDRAVAQVADLAAEDGVSQADEEGSDSGEHGEGGGGAPDLSMVEGFEILGEEDDREDSENDFESDYEGV